MVRTLLLASVSTSSSSDTATTASRDSNGSSSSSSFSADLGGLLPDCDSSRPSSVTEDDARRVSPAAKRIKYLSSFATRFSSVLLHRGSKKDSSSARATAQARPRARAHLGRAGTAQAHLGRAGGPGGPCRAGPRNFFSGLARPVLMGYAGTARHCSSAGPWAARPSDHTYPY